MSHHLTEAFHQYARNRRFSECVECPKDGEGRALPELCVNTERYDHQLDLANLVSAENWQKAEDEREYARALSSGREQ